MHTSQLHKGCSSCTQQAPHACRGRQLLLALSAGASGWQRQQQQLSRRQQLCQLPSPQQQQQQQQQRAARVVPAATPPPGDRASDAAGARGQQQQQQRRQQLFGAHTAAAGAAGASGAAAGDDGSDEVEEQVEGECEEEGEWELEEEDEGAEGEFEYEEGEEEEAEEEEEEEEEDKEQDEAAAAGPPVKVIAASAATATFTQDDFVEVGRISRPHGVRGEVRVQLITDEPKKRLGTRGKRLWLKPLPASSGLVSPAAAAARQAGSGSGAAAAAGAGSGALPLRRVVVESGRVARTGGKGTSAEWAVKFEGVSSREQAAALSGHLLLLALCDREARPRGRDEFFVDQLVGMRAVHARSKALVGVVSEVYDASASYSLLRLRLAPEEADIAGSTFRSVLVPFVAEMVPSVDVAARVLGVLLPEGLLETASKPRRLRRPYTPAQQAQLRAQLAQRQQQQAAWEAAQPPQE